MNLKQVLDGLKYEIIGPANVKIGKATSDSRAVKRGDLFIAFRGFAEDGYKYIGQAVSKGAGAIVSEKDFDAPAGVVKVMVKDTRKALPVIAANFYGHPSDKLKMVGITGTNGKTTTTYVIENILKTAGKEAAVIGTISYRYKAKEIPATNTTPGPFELQALLADMVKAKVKVVAMEVSSHSLDQGRVDGIEFDAAIFSNLTGDHLDYHKTMGSYFDAKAKLFKKLKKGGVAILNYDDKKVRSLKKSLKCDVLTYGLGSGADIQAVDVKLSLDGSEFRAKTPRGSFDIRTSLIGKHNISNLMAGLAAAYSQKIPDRLIKKGIETVKFAPGRLEPVSAGQPFKIFVDYAHTHDALFNILSLLKEVNDKSKIITVFGCGGNRDRTKRPRMGEVACKYSDRVIITSDNPRLEEPLDIIKEIEDGIKKTFTNYQIVEERREAIRTALGLASKDDIVVIAGKGHEKYQLVKGKVFPFDDCEVAVEILRGKGQGARVK